MVGNDADTNNSPSQNNNKNSSSEYLSRASQACAAGDVVLGLHLYLAAYERSLQDSSVPDAAVINGLHQAWNLACEHKERSLAEYIFEKLEPYLSADEVAQFAGSLQRLALDKLEEFGLSREDLEDMTEMISQDFFGADPSNFFLRMEQTIPKANMFGFAQRGLVRDHSKTDETAQHNGEEVEQYGAPDVLTKAEKVEESSARNETNTSPAKISEKVEAAVDLPEEVKASEDTSLEGTQPADQSGKKVSKKQESAEKPASAEKVAKTEKATNVEKPANGEGSRKINNNIFNGLVPFEGTPGLFTLPSIGTAAANKTEQTVEIMTYKDLVGYETAIEAMRVFGIGMENDPAFKELVETLNARHGLSKIPVTDSFLFRSPVREDANHFMLATMGEIGLPAIRMRMEENLQGMPVLCVMASPDNHPRLNASRNAIEGRGVLILEDIDLWGAPLTEAGNDDTGGFMYAQLSRGAREAMNLIRSAVENPDVFVLMSTSSDSEIETFFLDFLEPLTVVDVEYPTAVERADLWANIAKEHPSVKAIDRGSLVRYSSNMSRYDIYMAAREAVEDAYKASLMAKEYVSVSPENLYEKIAAYQPLESEEYQQLEDAVVGTFFSDLDDLDDLLKGKSD